MTRQFRIIQLASFFLLTFCLLMPARTLAATPSPTTTLTIVPAASVPAGTVVTLTASVSSAGRPVSPGLVLFCDAAAPYCGDIHVLGQAQLTSSGTAAVKLRLGIGERIIKAVFQGRRTYAASGSSSKNLNVTGKLRTSTDVYVDRQTFVGQQTFYGRVTSYGKLPATGALSFLDATNQNYPFASAALSPEATAFAFNPAYSLAVNYEIGVFGVGDFNKDGIPDLAIEDISANAVNILLGAGDGKFVSGSRIGVGQGASAIAVGDLNSDGRADLVVVNYDDNTATVLLGNGDGTFAVKSTVGIGNYPSSLALGDFNGDGTPDLAVTNQLDGTVTILLGKGDGTFVIKGTVLAKYSPDAHQYPVDVEVADFNGDGIQDLTVADAGVSLGSGEVAILLGNGDGSFRLVSETIPPGTPTSQVVADFNGDGIPDLAIGNTDDSRIWIMLGNGDGTFTVGSTPTVLYSPGSVGIADFNGDGIPDLAVDAYTGSNIICFLLLGNGDGTFGAASAPVLPAPLSGLSVADFNGDGIPDLATILGDQPPYTMDILLGEFTSVSSGSVSGVTVPGGGVHHVYGSKRGDDTHIGSTTPKTWSMAGTMIQPSVLLAVSPGLTVPRGTTVQLTANVTPAAYANYTASGTVTFYDDSSGGAALATVNVTNGQAAFSTNSLGVGTHILYAAYSGDANFSAGTSVFVTVTID